MYSCCIMCLVWKIVGLIECWHTCCWSVLLRLYLVFLLMRICANWIENELKWLNCLHAWKQMVNYDGDEIELRWWSSKFMMKCEVMNDGRRPIVLFIFAYQIWMKIDEIEMSVTPNGRGLPQLKLICGGDSRNWNWYEAGTPARKRKEWAGTPAREKEKNGGDSRKRKRNVYGGDSRKRKRNVYGGDSREWMMIWWGLPQKKGWASSNVRGCEFDKQTWRGENWPPKINYTYKWIV